MKSNEKGRIGRSVKVAVLGIPNAGKSSFINRLCNKKTTVVGNRPGVTKAKQWIRISKNQELLDTPGVLWPKFQNNEIALNLAFTGTIKDDILERVEVAYELLKVLHKDYKKNLQERYKISDDEMKEIENTSGAVTDLQNLRNKLNTSIKNKTMSNNEPTASSMPISRDKIKQNTKVYITTIAQNGIIVSNINKSDEVQVQIGLIKTNVNIKYLEEPHNLKDDLTKPVASSHATISKTRMANSEINVIGLSVDEAIPLVDKFLDDCFLAKLKTARIVHGKGTGKLRQGIHSFLKKHHRVKSYRIGTYGEGEMGVTVVEM